MKKMTMAVVLVLISYLAAGHVHAYSSLLQVKMDFEEPAGDTVMNDSSGNRRIAYLKGGATTTDAGHAGRGLTLDGSDDLAVFTDRTNWDCNDAITICVWVKPANDGVVLERGTWIRPFALIINGSGSITWAVATSDSGDTRYTSAALLTFNEWHHVAVVYSAEAGSSSIYLDGTLIKAGGLTGMLSSRDDDYTWKIGNRNNRTWFAGTMDDLRVYSRAISPLEISNIYNGTEAETDTEPPSVPQNVTAAAVSPREVHISWDQSTDNTKVAGYKIYKDGHHLATTLEDATGWSAYWLQPETQYSFTVSAFDYDSNESAVSAAATVTTDKETYPDYYVGGWNINHEMDKISPACMETLRTKHVFGYTKSWGGSMLSGYSRLDDEGSPYVLSRADRASPDSADIANYNIIKADTTRYPYSARIEALGTTLDNWLAPHVDAVFIFWSEMNDSYQGPFDTYSRIFDSLRTAYPDIDFLYTTGGIVGEYELDKINNMNAMMFAEKLQNRYRGTVPIYDMTSLMSVQADDDTSAFWVPYAQYEGSVKSELATYVEANDRIADPDSMHVPVGPNSGLHPNGEFEKRLALGMTLTLAKLYCTECFPQDGQTTGVRQMNPVPFDGSGFKVIRSADYVTVRWQDNVPARLTLYTMDGRMMGGTGLVTDGLASISTQHLPVGLYMMEVELDGKTEMVKIAVVK